MQCSWRMWLGTYAADLAFDKKRTTWGAAFFSQKRGPKYRTREPADRSEVLARVGGI